MEIKQKCLHILMKWLQSFELISQIDFDAFSTIMIYLTS